MVIGPEFEFYLFDSARYEVTPQRCGYRIDAKQADWNCSLETAGNNGYAHKIMGRPAQARITVRAVIMWRLLRTSDTTCAAVCV